MGCRRSCSLRIQPPASNESFYIVAGLGVVGPCGPRSGSSSGMLPGNSSGRGDSPGSRTGGGMSGWGLPGGASCGGSVGFPGVAGGISGGSIGIYIETLRLSPIPGRALSLVILHSMAIGSGAITAPLRRCSCRPGTELAAIFSPAACCCGSCRSRRSRAKTCRRCSHSPIRRATDVRSPPRAATALAALP
jgi:hypothetical protein